MKKRIISMLIMVTWLITLLPAAGVSAEEIMYGDDKYYCEGISGEYIVVDIDFTIKSGQSSSFGIRAFDYGDPQGLPFGAVRFSKSGDILISSNAKAWDQDWWGGSDFIDKYKKAEFEHDREYNLKMRLDYENQLVEYFLDNTLIGKNTSGKCYGYWWNIAFVGERADSDLFVRKVNSVIAVKRGEMFMSLAGTDEEKITVSFSEPPDPDIDFSQSLLVNTNEVAGGGEDAYISGCVRKGGTVELTYANALKPGCEYALILPENITGTLGGALDENCLYFSTDSTVQVEGKSYTFDDYDESTDLRFVQTVDGADVLKNTLAIEEGKSGNGLLVDYSDSYDSDYKKSGNIEIVSNPVNYLMANHGTPAVKSADTQVLSMDIKPLHDNLMASFRILSSTGNPIITGFAKNGRILGGRNWDTYEIMKAADDWWNQRITLNNQSWAKDEWINIRFEWDTVNKAGKFYINGQEATNKNAQYSVGSAAVTHSGIETIRLIVYQNEMNIPEEDKPAGLMILDNVTTYGITKNVTVSKVRFYEADGTEKGPRTTVDRVLDSVKVYFNNDVNTSTVTADTVTLTYDGVAVESELTYLSGERCAVIKPKTLPGRGAKVSVEVDGVIATNQKTVSHYLCSATAANTEDTIAATAIALVNAGGTAVTEITGSSVYLDTTLLNTTALDQTLVVSAMGYKDGALERYAYEYVTLPAGTGMELNQVTTPFVSIDTQGLDSVRGAVQVLATGEPVSGGILIGAEAPTSGTWKISGTAEKLEAGSQLLIEVYAPGTSHTDIDNVTADNREVLLYKTQITTDENKMYLVPFEVTYPSSPSGMYRTIVSGKGYQDTFEILYVNPTEARTVLNESLLPAIAAGNSDAVGEILLTSKYNLYIDDKYINEAIADEAGAILVAYSKTNTLTETNARTVINQAVAIAALNQGAVTDIVADADIFDLENSDIAGIYDADYVSASNIANLTERMAAVKYTDIDSFYEKLEDELVFEIVLNPARPGVVKEICTAAGLGGYSSKAYTAVSGKSYTTIDDLKSDLDKANTTTGSSGGGGGGSSGGGSSSSSSNSSYIGGNAVQLPIQLPKEETPFLDLAGYEWAEDAILTLYDEGVVNGTSATTFEPARTVMREEFVKMLCAAFGLGTLGGRTVFEDVVPGEWYEGYIKKAAETGIVTGMSETWFGVGDQITRQDMAVILYRALNQKGKVIESVDGYFADAGEIAEYAQTAVWALSGIGIVNGVGNDTFAPRANATRAEAAVMIQRCVDRFSL